MFLVCTGALQSIPKDLKEAAFVDGATGLTAFRKVTFPLLLVAVSPLLIASFAFNFNNFTIVYLLTNGGPRLVGRDRRCHRHPAVRGRIASRSTATPSSKVSAPPCRCSSSSSSPCSSAIGFKYTKAYEEVR